MTKGQRAHIESTIDLIDSKRRELEEEYKNTQQYKSYQVPYIDITIMEIRNGNL